jgi:hypothetical protein
MGWPPGSSFNALTTDRDARAGRCLRTCRRAVPSGPRGVLTGAEKVVRGVDVTGTMSGLSLALLAAHGQRVRNVPGRTVNQMASAYRGEAETDARDAYVIAETLRHRWRAAKCQSLGLAGDRAATAGDPSHRLGRRASPDRLSDIAGQRARPPSSGGLNALAGASTTQAA